ncbi:MAG: prolipoprotein diacylglyceryl transferase [Deltaproteobacteria bacterium]|nr:prolipoprotein diacylglyceryl transferase [Deltaproteobacteria bacterium]
MRPFLFYIGNTAVPAFFPSIMAGALLMTWAAYRLARQRGLSPVAILDMGIIGILASIVGARLFHVLVEYPHYYWEDPRRIFYFWQGGFVSLGAFIAAVAGWLIYFRVRRLSLLPYLDIAGQTCPIIVFFVRLGCLLIGCCYGKPTDFFLHLTFNHPGATAYHFFPGIPLHATQPYFMANAVIAFLFLRWLSRRRSFHGQITAAFLLYYGISRFLLEFLRGDADRGLYFHQSISTGQIVMLCFIVAGTLLYRLAKRRLPISGIAPTDR